MTKNLFKMLTLCLALVGASAGLSLAAPQTHSQDAQAARADIQKALGFVPRFFDAFADSVLPGAWEEMKGLQLNPGTALPGRTKELIGLAVASQVPCRYCIFAHTEFALLNGANDTQVAEAVALAGLERHWSAYLYGAQIDENKFRADIGRLVANAKKPSKPAAAIEVTDAKSAFADIEATLGFVPDFMRAVPASALPGAWREMKDLKLSQSTSIPAKEKALIELAVASQVPSRLCIFAETELAKLAGASAQEISEALGMAALTRNMSTLVNGSQADENEFRQDIAKLVRNVKNAQRATASKH